MLGYDSHILSNFFTAVYDIKPQTAAQNPHHLYKGEKRTPALHPFQFPVLC